MEWQDVIQDEVCWEIIRGAGVRLLMETDAEEELNVTTD